jgi:hypothetical protein
MMTRNYYESIDLERYRQHRTFSMQHWDQRNAALELSYAERQQMRSAPILRPERMPSDNEQDSQNGNSQTRRQRIAVAVSMVFDTIGQCGWLFALILLIESQLQVHLPNFT